MRRKIDVAFIAADGRVLKSLRALRPGQTSSQQGAWACLERYASSEAWVEVGECMEINLVKKGEGK
jgi:uncharacterized membrane protein (UPF0127 family)